MRERDVVDGLAERFAAMSFGATRIIFVLGHPRSGIGKGQLVARLASLVPEPATAIKYEGMLNTNDSDNHPSPTDDVGTYARFCPDVTMGWPNQILAGEVVRDFIDTYGGTGREHLMFVPHLAQHLTLHLHRAWTACGSPATLFVEIGGTLTDPELTAFALPAIALLQARHGRVGVLLVTEVAFDGEEPKARPIRQALLDLRARGLAADLVFVRLPEGAPEPVATSVPDAIEGKLRDSWAFGGGTPAVVTIPHFMGDDLEGYRAHLAGCLHLLPHGPAECDRTEAAMERA